MTNWRSARNRQPLWYNRRNEVGVRCEECCPNPPCRAANFLGPRGRTQGEFSNAAVKLYVGNLPYSTGEDELRELFAQAGNVVSVAVIRDRDSGRSKGFGFVEMGSDADAQAAISKFNSYKLGDRALTVNPARPREERSD